MNVDLDWPDDSEATDTQLIEELEREILRLKSELSRLSRDEELVF